MKFQTKMSIDYQNKSKLFYTLAFLDHESL